MLDALLSLLLILGAGLEPAPETRERSNCHIFVDHEIIWTVAIVEALDQAPIRIVNIITFEMGEAPLRPEQIQLFDQQDRTAEIKRFKIETGFDPYFTSYLRVLPSSFIGV